ncbi:MAG TPA: DUF6531 domain-containing protein, partial [Kribbellaceae bacterium]
MSAIGAPRAPKLLAAAAAFVAAAFIVASPAQAGYRDVVLGTPDLMSYWRLGEATGTRAVDIKSGRDATYVNQPGAFAVPPGLYPLLGVPGAITGDADTAISTLSNNYGDLNGGGVDIPFPNTFAFTGRLPYTYEVWIDPLKYPCNFDLQSDCKGRGTIFEKPGSSSVYMDYTGRITAVRSRQDLPDGTTSTCTDCGTTELPPSPVVSRNQWHHVAITFDGLNFAGYLDGKRWASISSTLAINTYPTHPILASGWCTGVFIGPDQICNPFDGATDEFAIYNRALTESEVAAHANWARQSGPMPSMQYGPAGPPEFAPNLPRTCAGDPVNCATGNFSETYTDFEIGGRGVGLKLARTYNAQAAVGSQSVGMFGYGWSSSFGESLSVDQTSGQVTVTHGTGATATFAPDGSGGYLHPAWVQSRLQHNDDGSYTYTLPDQRSLRFNANGRLESEGDRNGNATTLAYDGNGRLLTVTDPVGRKLTFLHNADGTVSKVTDPAGRAVGYAYASGNLTSVTDVSGGITKFTYDTSHRMTIVTSPRLGKTTNTYDTSNRVTAQIDPLGKKTLWAYTADETKITDPTGVVTTERFVNGLPVSIIKAQGTAVQAQSTFEYDGDGNLVSTTDANGHKTTFGYDTEGNRTSVRDALGKTTRSTFNSTHDVTSVTTPLGQRTDYDYDAAGNLIAAKRTLTETSETSATTYAYDSFGQLTSTTDPRGGVTRFAYDDQGDRTSTTTPEGRRTTATFDVVGRQLSQTSPRGNASGADPAAYTTTFTRDAFGQPTDIKDPGGKHTLLTYDADHNLTTVTDRDGRKTTTVLDLKDQPTQVTRGDGSVIATAYDANGNAISQTDGLKKVTKYTFDAQQRLSSVTDPLLRKTSFGYDGAGNMTSQTDPSGKVTTYRYDDIDRRTSVSYSTGSPEPVSFGYDDDGRRTSMTDASGTTTYAYDSLGRLTSSTNGAGQTTGYSYDLADEVTRIAYPAALTPLDLSGSADPQQVSTGNVERTYDADGNLASVKDWLDNTTRFAYDAGGNLSDIDRPNGTSAHYTHDANDAMTAVDDAIGQASYGRNGESLLSSVTAGGSTKALTYDGAQRVTGYGTSAYKYNAGDNLVQTATSAGQAVTQAFDAANELTSTTQGSVKTNTFTYDTRGNRIKGIDNESVATTYTYDQADQLISFSGPNRAAQSQTVSQQYTYNGDG